MNAASAELVGELVHAGLKALVLGHLSETNNEPVLAYRSAREVLAGVGVETGEGKFAATGEGDVTLLVARQDRPGTVLKVA